MGGHRGAPPGVGGAHVLHLTTVADTRSAGLKTFARTHQEPERT